MLEFIAGVVFGGTTVWLILRAHRKGQEAWSDTFKALAADTLRANNESFLQLAEVRLKRSEQAAVAAFDKKTVVIGDMMKPVQESLVKMDEHLQALEVKREGAYRELLEVTRFSHETQQQLRNETGQLLQALRTPTTRGRWGEIQLRRILEMTGMSEHVKDFDAQQSIQTDEGTLRPDVIVNLPGERCIIIDSKVPLASYLDATQASDEASRQKALEQHARHVREHVKALSAKSYWDQVEGTPEFVVLFMPGDHFLSAALDSDPELMDLSVKQKVILATPMTLVALLRTVAYGWRQEALRENARRIGILGSELYGALATMMEHVNALGNKLSGSVDYFNRLIGSLDRNVLPKARRLSEYGAKKEGKNLADALEPIDLTLRSLTVDEDEADEDAA